MKRLMVVLLLLLPAFAAAQFSELYTRADTSKARTTWTKVEKGNYQKIFWLEVSNDSASGSAVIYVAFEDDTTDAKRFALKYGESAVFEPLNVTHVYIRSSSGTIPYRIRYH